MVWLLRSNNGCRHTSGSTGFTFQVNMDSLNGWPPKVWGGGGGGVSSPGHPMVEGGYPHVKFIDLNISKEARILEEFGMALQS